MTLFSFFKSTSSDQHLITILGVGYFCIIWEQAHRFGIHSVMVIRVSYSRIKGKIDHPALMLYIQMHMCISLMTLSSKIIPENLREYRM